MREQFTTKQELVTEIGLQTYQICRNETIYEVQDGDSTRTVYEYDTYTVSGVTRNELISEIVSKEYPFKREIREIRKALAHIASKYEDEELEDFKRYNDFVEGVSKEL